VSSFRRRTPPRPVNSSPLTPKELVHLVHVSIASKYGADLAQLTRVLAEDMRNTLNLFWCDLDNNLPKQIRLVLREVMGDVHGKRVSESGCPPPPVQQSNVSQGGPGAAWDGGGTIRVANLNLPQPFY
jgi:hypothetical protein